ncbi:MAG: DUF1275 domain-containing protein [Betaproteobacteria bacterium]|nr:DUF1275 domain-containing protein [Betaproteobacteria bacterium]MDE2621913.1 DUF1275 domain-containing protein [Betaproteobacteria bacterium]
MKNVTVTEGFGLLFLSCASGCTDVLAFMKLGDVFTSGMTGNVALLAIAISKGHMLAAVHSLLAFAGFIFGAAMTAALYDPDPANLRRLPHVRPLFWLEIGCLAGFALIWHVADGPTDEGVAVYMLILLSAIGMGIQGVTARNIGPAGISTIVFTSTLINIVIFFTHSLLHDNATPRPAPDPRHQVGTFAAYALGAVVSGLLIWHGISLFAWLPLLCVVLALFSYELAHRYDHAPARATRNDRS